MITAERDQGSLSFLLLNQTLNFTDIKEVTNMNKSSWTEDLNLSMTELTVLEPWEEELLEMFLPLCVSSSNHTTWIPGYQGCYLQARYLSDA